MRSRMIAVILVAVAAAAGARAAEEGSGAAGTLPFPRQRLVVPARGVYVAAFPDLGGGEDQVSIEKIEDYEKLVGKQVAWVYFSNNWYDGIEFPAEDVAKIHAAGSVPFIRLMARSRGARRGRVDPAYSMQAIIDGKFDEALRQWARDARDVARPLLAEFGTEVNGSWFPWNGRWNGGGATEGYGDAAVADGPERFRDAYRRIITICREEGARNIVWFFHVNTARPAPESWNTMAAYYPGDDYIDWLGISVFGSQRVGREWRSFTETFDESYAEFEAISQTKPLAVLEYAVVEDPASGDKALWIAEALGAIKNDRYPRIKAVSYWHESWGSPESRIQLRIDSSPAALAAYKKAIADPFFVPHAQFDITPGTVSLPAGR